MYSCRVCTTSGLYVHVPNMCAATQSAYTTNSTYNLSGGNSLRKTTSSIELPLKVFLKDDRN